MEAEHETIKIWNLSTMPLLASLRDDNNRIRCIMIQLSDGRLATGNGRNNFGRNNISIWDLSTQQIVVVLEGHKKAVRCLTQLSNNCLISCSFEMTIKIWDLSTMLCVASLRGNANSALCLTKLSAQQAVVRLLLLYCFTVVVVDRNSTMRQ